MRIRPRTTSAALGESHAAPFDAAFTATTRLSIGVSLERKPTAPACSTAETSASSEETVSASTLMLGVALDDLPCRLGPRDVGHTNVHEDHVGAELGGETDAHLPARGLSDDLDPRLLGEQRRQTRTKQVVIIDHEQSHHGLHRSTRCPSVIEASPIRSRGHPGASAAPRRRIAPGAGRATTPLRTSTKVQGTGARCP